MTICFLIKEGKYVCLAEKKRGFRQGKINGYGGKVEPGETVDEAAVREVLEESGLLNVQIIKKGIVNFVDPEVTHICHIYIAQNWEGEVQETDEMKPEWYEIDKIPFDRMGPADKTWVPHVLQGHNIQANFYYDKDNTITKQKIEVTTTAIKGEFE